MTPKITIFKSKPILELPDPLAAEDGRAVSFGLYKARIILANVEAIRRFVASNGASCDGTG